MVNNIRYISASDRLNYGDLLFPIIFCKYFEASAHIKVHNYGIVSSDFSFFGAIPTKSFKTLRKEIKINDVLVVGGGEVFFGSWQKLLTFISPSFELYYRFRFLRRIEDKLNLAKFFLGGSGNISPFLPELGVDTVFIAGGGQFSKNISNKTSARIRNILNSSVFLSVRDNRTYKSFEENGVNSVRLVPDSAVLVSKVYSRNELNKLASTTLTDIGRSKYIFLQVGKNKAPSDIYSFVMKMGAIALKNNATVICSPIGISPGHEDHMVLKKIVNHAPEWRMIMPNSVYDTMFLIASAWLYVGTSLHGAITAFAYNLPIVPLNKRIKKLDSFVETWCSEFYIRNVDFEDIESGVVDAIRKWDPVLARMRLSEMQSKVESAFQIVEELIIDRRALN